MTTSFSSLPIVDLSLLSSTSPSTTQLKALSDQLSTVFATTGFAYLINPPLSFTHDDLFALSDQFFRLSPADKLAIAKKTFVKENPNTYRGYFPTQPGQMDNLKEGFEMGSSSTSSSRRTWSETRHKFDLTETNVWPSETSLPDGRASLEMLYAELQDLASTLLSLLAVSLGKEVDFFSSYLVDSLSTLRLLHYPPQLASSGQNEEAKLCCTPHTDSGILTLLHQDPTGGLEVLNADGDWIPAPYVPRSIVVNIGDLLARVSGGKFVATMHRVRTSSSSASQGGDDRMGRFSVPFFFEPGEQCVVRSVDGGESIVYGEYVRMKMGTWVEYQDDEVKVEENKISTVNAVAVEA
jgi:isopenicillin N synthase-like dioxygenase